MTDPRLSEFKKIVFFTGAGMSAESGVPTYRGAGGIWKQYDYQRYACQTAFDRDPEAVWEFHNFRRGLVAKCAPNAGHRLIARAEQVLPTVTVVTQNIDGLHALAGSTRIHELHGNLWRVRCDACGVREQDGPVLREQLRCQGCGGFWRPDIVWFGDCLDEAVIRAATEVIEGCDLLVSVGTSAVVHPAARLPEYARAAGALCVEINPDETPASHLYTVHMRGPATEMLARLAAGALALTALLVQTACSQPCSPWPPSFAFPQFSPIPMGIPAASPLAAASDPPKVAVLPVYDDRLFRAELRALLAGELARRAPDYAILPLAEVDTRLQPISSTTRARCAFEDVPSSLCP